MAIEVKVPVLPESVSDATIADWHKKAGDAVSRDENLVDLETDKVVLEVPSPVDGVLKEIKFESGDTVNSEQVIALIEEGAAAPAPSERRQGRRRPSPRLLHRPRPRRPSPPRVPRTCPRPAAAWPPRKASMPARSRAPAAAAA